MKLKVVSFGKKTDDYCGDIDRYCKMIKPWVSMEFEYLKPPSALSADSVQLEKEAMLIKSHWLSSSLVISLAEEGELFTTEKLAKWFEKNNSAQNIVVNIGSAYGLSPSIKKESDLLLSMSPLTFNYKLCRLVLAEQLYRVFSFINGHPYHK